MENHTIIKLYTVKEISEFLKVSERSIYRWIEEGKIHAYTLGEGILASRTNRARVLIPEWALKEFLQLNTPDETIEKLKKHQDFILETLQRIQKETNPKNIHQIITQIIKLILN